MNDIPRAATATEAPQPTPAEPLAPTPTVVVPPTETAAPAAQVATAPPPPPAAATSAPPPASAPPPPVVVNLSAQNLSYSISQVQARSGALVSVNFSNRDTSIPHDVTFGPAPGLPHGNTCYGPCEDHYTFTAPAAGRYQFFCSVHAEMVGTFIVDP